jgi:hypothetical protein
MGNWVYDVIHDEIIKSLEREALFPEEYTLTLPDDQMAELIKEGLQDGSKKKLPKGTSKVYITVYDMRILVRNESFANADTVDTRH